MFLSVDYSYLCLMDLKFTTANSFRNLGATSMEEMMSSRAKCLLLMGSALNSARKTKVKDALVEAWTHGLEAQQFTFINERLTAHTALLALLWRGTDSSRKLTLDLLGNKKGDAWDLSVQKSRMVGIYPDDAHQFCVLPFETSLMLNLAANMGPGALGERVEAMESWLQKCDRHTEVDWNRTVYETGENPLALLARCVNGEVLQVCWEALKDRGADPFMPGYLQLNAMEILESRLRVGAVTGSCEQAARAVLAKWREMALERRLEEGPELSSRPSSRM